MAAPLLVSSFMGSLAQRVREFAVPELFRGRPSEASYRLVLDHAIPLRLTDSREYDLFLSAQIRFVQNDRYYSQFFSVKMIYCADVIVCGPANWPAFIDSLAYQLVANLRVVTDQLTRPVFLIVKSGDISQLLPHMRRIWIP
jgi:hypothetical protein